MSNSSYFIQFRFQGKVKHQISNMIGVINHSFGLKARKAVPHITIAGPFKTVDEKKLIEDFKRICSKNPLLNFEVIGFGLFEKNKVIFLDIIPGKELKEFRWKISQTLQSYCQMSQFDYKRHFAFHATIKNNLPENTFIALKEYIKKQPQLHFKHIIIRVTLLKDSIILKEYDFLLERLLNRRLALSKLVLAKTFHLLKDQIANRRNIN